MTYLAETVAIQALFDAGWDQATYPVAWPNLQFDWRDDAVDGSGRPKAWVRFSIAGGFDGAFQASLGPTPIQRHTGVVFVQVFAPMDKGASEALTLADTAAAVFRGQSTAGVTFRTPSVNAVGSDGTFYQVNVTAPFWRDTTF